MARFYADEQYPYPVVECLRILGHDVLTVQEAGNDHQRIPDPDVLAFATREGRAVLTQNRKERELNKIRNSLTPTLSQGEREPESGSPSPSGRRG
jgi:predicted nuclease of predicted toxin-antitoxin system